LRERRFISPSNSLFVLLLLIYPLISTGCGARSVWGIPIDDLRARLFKADFAVLKTIDFKAQNPAEALDLDPSAPYYLSFVFDALEKPDLAGSMLALAWERSPRPWKEQAGLLLAARLITEKEYAKAAEVGGTLVSLLAGTPDEAKARRLLAEAFYWSKEDAKTLVELEKAPRDTETALFKAVSSLRLKLPTAHDLCVDLFLNEKASPVLARAYLFLSADKDMMALFSDWEKEFFAAKYAFQQGDWAKGLLLLEGVVPRLGSARLSVSPIVSEMGSAYMNRGLAPQGVAFLEKLSRTLEGSSRLDALEAAAKCARRALSYGPALTWFREVAEKSTSADRQDRMRWYILDILLKTRPADLMDRIARDSVLWHDPSYFSDLLEDEITSLVAGRKWETIAKLSTALGDGASGPVKAQLAYILARLVQKGALPRLAGAPGMTADALLHAAIDANPTGYYGVLASCILGVLPRTVLSASPPQGGGKPAVLDPYIDGFITFGLHHEAFDVLFGRLSGMDDGLIKAYTARFLVAQDYRSVLNLMGALARRRSLSDDEMRLLYPRAFASVIESVSAGSPFSQSFLYGLIRTESYFDKDIVSGAGAVGLAQLMPATAADVAARMKISKPDLTDPQTSITLGLNHLEGLLDRLGSLPKALLAYNAGLSRVRSWEPLGAGLTSDILVEAVPYDESRGYVQNILVSTVVYAYLYEKRDPRETVKLFYQDIY
jgi:hypothetical protein